MAISDEEVYEARRFVVMAEALERDITELRATTDKIQRIAWDLRDRAADITKDRATVAQLRTVFYPDED